MAPFENFYFSYYYSSPLLRLQLGMFVILKKFFIDKTHMDIKII